MGNNILRRYRIASSSIAIIIYNIIYSWEQRKLYEVADFNPKSELPEIFEYVDLEAVVGTEMISHRTETRDTAPSRAQRLAQTRDVFFQTVRPYQRNNYLFEKPDNNYVFSTGYAQMRPKIDAEFLMCFLQTDSFVKVVLDNCTGTSYPAINSNDLSNLEISLPVSEEEQRKIGGFITNIDNLITLHQCEYLVPFSVPTQNNKSCFPTSWEQRKLEDVVEFLDTMRKPLEGAKRVAGPYPYYGASGIVDYVDGYIFDEELVLLSEDGANITDRNYPVCFLVSGKYWVNNHAHVLRTKIGNENNFICNSLERKDYKQYNTGMAMPKLNQEVCRSIPVSCPSFEEQKKIGDYFRNIDNLITLHQREQFTGNKVAN